MSSTIFALFHCLTRWHNPVASISNTLCFSNGQLAQWARPIHHLVAPNPQPHSASLTSMFNQSAFLVVSPICILFYKCTNHCPLPSHPNQAPLPKTIFICPKRLNRWPCIKLDEPSRTKSNFDHSPMTRFGHRMSHSVWVLVRDIREDPVYVDA